jgi:hypothetical protein
MRARRRCSSNSRFQTISSRLSVRRRTRVRFFFKLALADRRPVCDQTWLSMGLLLRWRSRRRMPPSSEPATHPVSLGRAPHLIASSNAVTAICRKCTARFLREARLCIVVHCVYSFHAFLRSLSGSRGGGIVRFIIAKSVERPRRRSGWSPSHAGSRRWPMRDHFIRRSARRRDQSTPRSVATARWSLVNAVVGATVGIRVARDCSWIGWSMGSGSWSGIAM